MVACNECSRNRIEDVLISPMGFFKERVYQNSMKVLPISNAQKIAPLIEKEVEIKDINGRSWTVETSYIDGSLAFGRGWSRFVSDHGIKNNMQVLFHQMSRSKFLCVIFCARGNMKRQFPSTYQDTESSSSRNEGLSNSNTTKINEEVSLSVYMGSNADRRWVLVPSEFEMYKMTNGSSLDKDVGCSNHAFEADMRMLCDSDYIGNPIHGENFGSTAGTEHKSKHSDVFPETAPCQGSSLDAQSGDLYTQTAAFQGQTTDVTNQGPESGAQTTDFNGQTTAPSDQGGRRIIVKEKRRRVEEKRPNSVGGIAQRVKYNRKRSADTRDAGLVKKEPMSFKPRHDGSTSDARLVKKEPMESKPQHIGSSRGPRSLKKEPTKFEPQGVESNSYQVSKKVKMEAEDFTEPPPAVSCAVASDSNYLELPKEFPSLIYSTNRNVEKEVECLMDPAGRVWPVMWCRILEKNILNSGWKSIRDANGIRTGDECFFLRDEEYQDIILMKVVQK